MKMKPILLLVLIGFSSLNVCIGDNRRNSNSSQVTSFKISPKISYYPDDGETDTLTEIIKAQLSSEEPRDSLSNSGRLAEAKNYDTSSSSDSGIKEHGVGSGESKDGKSVYHYYYPATMTSNVGNGKSLSNADSIVEEDQPIPSYSYPPAQSGGYQSGGYPAPDMSYGAPPSPSPQYGYPQSPPASGYDTPAPPAPPQPSYGYPAPSPAPASGYGYAQPSPPPLPPVPQPTYGYPAPAPPAPQPSYGYPAAPTDSPAPSGGYGGYAPPPPAPAPMYGYPAAPQPPQGGYPAAMTDYGYGQGAGNLPSIAVDGGFGGGSDFSAGGGGGAGGDGGPPPPPPPPPAPAPIKGSIDYILIPLILIGIAGPVFVVLYVVLGSMEAKLAPVLFKRSLSWASSIAESMRPTTDALMSSVSRALDKHECWERMACHAGSFCHRHGISSSDSVDKKLESYVPQGYQRQYRAFTAAMKSSADSCSVYTCP